MAPAGMTECRAFGVVPNSNLANLANTLRGLCFKYSAMKIYEAVLRIQGKNTLVKMTKRMHKQASQHPFMEKLPDRWLMLWESDPLRGPIFKELPAAVREVCESHCFCVSAPEFWRELGATLEFDMLKDGNEYICSHNGFEIRVQLVRISALQMPGVPESAPKNCTEKYIIDVSTRVPEGKHVEGARAVGSFGLALSPLVTLQRAEKPIG